MSWKDLLSTASASQTLTRARGCLNRRTVYKSPGDHLGSAADPVNPFPRRADCSAFVCYALGIPRQLPPGSNRWLSTDEIWRYGSPTLPGLFDPVTRPAEGDFVVYPDYRVNGRNHDGHVGIATEVEDGTVTKVIHCSLGNYNRNSEAVQITGLNRMGLRPGWRIVRPDYDLLRATFGIAPVRPRLIIAIPSGEEPGNFDYIKVRSAQLVDGSFEVDPREVAEILRRQTSQTSRAQIRSVLNTLEVRFIADPRHLNDERDPRAYIFVEHS